MNNFLTWGNDSGNNRPFHGFFFNFWRGQELLNINKTAKFESEKS